MQRYLVRGLITGALREQRASNRRAQVLRVAEPSA